MQNRVITAMLVMVTIMGFIVIGYLIIKIVVILVKAHRSVDKTSVPSPLPFNSEAMDSQPSPAIDTEAKEDFSFFASDEGAMDYAITLGFGEEYETTLEIDHTMEKEHPFARIQFSKIADRPSERIEFIRKKVTVLGRAPHIDILVGDTMISKQHLNFLFVDGKLQIQDMCSRNGTFLDGEYVTPMIYVPVPDGSVVNVGKTYFSIHIDI